VAGTVPQMRPDRDREGRSVTATITCDHPLFDPLWLATAEFYRLNIQRYYQSGISSDLWADGIEHAYQLALALDVDVSVIEDWRKTAMESL
jgi:hypothetical protein